MIELAPAPTATLRFLTVAELREQTPARPAWLWDTNIAAGNLTLLIGKPKAGKTTLALGLATALATGADSFLGCDIHAAPVIYISEEAGGTLLHKLPDDGAHMHILTRDSAWPKPDWPQLVAAAVTQARKTRARLLVIDTASFWMALAADRGKDTGAVQAAMMPLVQATREGLAVVLVHHSRKAAGEDGDAALGSTAWVFSVDTILEVERPPDENAPPTQRLLIGLGRHPSTPPCALIDLDCSHR
jgi:RecA-family ATPase